MQRRKRCAGHKWIGCVAGVVSFPGGTVVLRALNWKLVNGGEGLFCFSYWCACKPVTVLPLHRGLCKGIPTALPCAEVFPGPHQRWEQAEFVFTHVSVYWFGGRKLWLFWLGKTCSTLPSVSHCTSGFDNLGSMRLHDSVTWNCGSWHCE